MDPTHEKGAFGNTEPDRRRARRMRVIKGAVVEFNGGFSAMECTMKNESETGALLSLAETTGVPQNFKLKVNGSEVLRETRVRWRRPERIGVEFLQD